MEVRLGLFRLHAVDACSLPGCLVQGCEGLQAAMLATATLVDNTGAMTQSTTASAWGCSLNRCKIYYGSISPCFTLAVAPSRHPAQHALLG